MGAGKFTSIAEYKNIFKGDMQLFSQKKLTKSNFELLTAI